MQSSSPQLWAELVLRRYAGQTNRLLAGRRFWLTAPDARGEALAAALAAVGARVVDDDAVDAVFGADALDAWFIDVPRSSAGERIDFARAHMPIVAELAGRLAERGLLTGRRVGICLVLEPKTAVLALALAAAGAQVSVFGHPEETDVAVAAELAARGVRVFADPDPEREPALVEQFLDQHLHLLIDDGSRLIRALLARPSAQRELIGAAEETTSGLRPLRALGSTVTFPVVAVNDAGSKLFFDNAHGTGQSCLMTILDLLDPGRSGWGLVGRRVAVAGFGPVGEGFARHVRALGGEVVVADLDPVARLRARFAGYATGDLVTLAADADLVVSATGHPHTITVEVMRAARAGAAVAVAGGVEDEVDWRAALAGGADFEPVADRVERLVFADGHAVVLLDRGGCINCTAGEGNPIEIMDLSFGVQLAAVETLLTTALPAGVQPLPNAADRLVCELGLSSSFGEV